LTSTRARVALGFRVKSGWAVEVLVALEPGGPRVLEHGTVLLSDPAVPGTRQPHHAGRGREQTDPARIRRLTRIIRASARRSVTDLLRRHRGLHLARAALVVGSDIDPAAIGNPHIRAHAAEGRLFRTALADALVTRGVRPFAIVERDLPTWAGAILRRPPARLRAVATALGRDLDGRWRAEEKNACLAAWALLAARPGARRA